MEPVRSYCRICLAKCGILVHTDGERVTRITGDRDHPTSHGYTCPKGRAAGEMIDHPRRIREPMMRSGTSAAAGQRPVTWDVLITDLAARLRGLIDEYGPDSVAVYDGTTAKPDSCGYFMMGRLRQAIGTSSWFTAATLDVNSKYHVVEAMTGRWNLTPCVDWERATLLILVGENTVVSHGEMSGTPDPVQRLRRIRERGAVWVVDPRLTETALHADVHLRIRPDGDAALFGYLVRELLRAGADRSYLAAHTIGVAELTAAVEPFDLPTAVERTGLSAAELTALVEEIRRHRSIAVRSGTGIAFGADANVTEWLIWALQAVTASLDRPGGTWFNAGWLREPVHADLPPPSSVPIHLTSRPELVHRFDQAPAAALADEIEHSAVRALLVLGSNPALAMPDSTRMHAALGSLDVLAVWDVHHSATAALATHVVPCPTMLERADVAAANSQPMVYAQYSPAVVAPPAGVRPTWWSIAQLAGALGFRVMPEGLDADSSSDEDVLGAFANGRITFEALRRTAAPVVFASSEVGWVEAHGLVGGRWQLAPASLVAQLAGSSSTGPAAPADGELVLITARSVHRATSTMAEGFPRSDADSVLKLSPDDAAGRGIEDGALVEVARGSARLTVRARIDASLPSGVVTMPFGSRQIDVNLLTRGGDALDPHTAMPQQTGLHVRVRPLVPTVARPLDPPSRTV